MDVTALIDYLPLWSILPLTIVMAVAQSNVVTTTVNPRRRSLVASASICAMRRRR